MRGFYAPAPQNIRLFVITDGYFSRLLLRTRLTIVRFGHYRGLRLIKRQSASLATSGFSERERERERLRLHLLTMRNNGDVTRIRGPDNVHALGVNNDRSTEVDGCNTTCACVRIIEKDSKMIEFDAQIFATTSDFIILLSLFFYFYFVLLGEFIKWMNLWKIDCFWKPVR